MGGGEAIHIAIAHQTKTKNFAVFCIRLVSYESIQCSLGVPSSNSYFHTNVINAKVTRV